MKSPPDDFALSGGERYWQPDLLQSRVTPPSTVLPVLVPLQRHQDGWADPLHPMTDEQRTREQLLQVVRNAPAASTPTARALMQRNRRRDSLAEIQLRSALHRLGLRFRVDYPIRCGPSRPIRPDVVFTKARLAVFVDGCFWHGCPDHGRSPKANSGYWSAKFALNQDRDRRQTIMLAAEGWTVLRVWEHEPADEAAEAIASAWARAAKQP